MSSYVIKHRNADFLVTEHLLLDTSPGNYFYYRLCKSGKGTFQCVKEIAEILNTEQSSIGYAGLKDEDGITQQYISIYNIKVDDLKRYDSEYCWFTLEYVGNGEKPIRIGQLDGNSFEIIVRNLSTAVSNELSHAEGRCRFVNYFDAQRFGLPGCEKLAHKVGAALLNNNYDDALLAAFRGGNVSEQTFWEYKNCSKVYWEQNDIRQNNFFLSAYSSYMWNVAVSEMLVKENSNAFLHKTDIITYAFSGTEQLVAKTSHYPILYHRYCPDGRVKNSRGSRNIFIETTVHYEILPKDSFFPEKQNVRLKFFLPPGCYATMMIKQIVSKFTGYIL